MNKRSFFIVLLALVWCSTEIYSVDCGEIACNFAVSEGNYDCCSTNINMLPDDISSKMYQCACVGLQKAGDFVQYWFPVAMSQEADHPQAIGIEAGKPIIQDGITVTLTEAEKNGIKQGFDSLVTVYDETVQVLKTVPENLTLFGEQIVKNGLIFKEKIKPVFDETVLDMQLRVFLCSLIKNKKIILCGVVGGLAGAGIGYIFLPVMKQKDASVVAKGVGIAAVTCMGALAGMYCCA